MPTVTVPFGYTACSTRRRSNSRCRRRSSSSNWGSHIYVRDRALRHRGHEPAHLFLCDMPKVTGVNECNAFKTCTDAWSVLCSPRRQTSCAIRLRDNKGPSEDIPVTTALIVLARRRDGDVCRLPPAMSSRYLRRTTPIRMVRSTTKEIRPNKSYARLNWT